MYVKTTIRMLTILREAEEWTHVHLGETCLLFVSAIMKSSLYVCQNDKVHAHQITLLSLAPYGNHFSSNNNYHNHQLLHTSFLRAY